MTARVTCETCNAVVVNCEADSPELVEALVTIAHNTVPHHQNHRLATVRGAGQHELVVRCVACRGREVTHRGVPLALVGALTLCFHAEHEGHPLELLLDGKRLHP